MMPRRDDEGATALVVALLMIFVLGLAAMAVDLGHAYSERQDVQKDVDFAALAGAGGSNLPGTTAGTCAYGQKAAASDQAVQDVADYLTSDTAGPWVYTPSAGGLVDCSLTNGEVLYGTVTDDEATGITLTYDPYHITVVSPLRAVDFGFAQVLGVDGTELSAHATAAIRSPMIGAVPLYAFNGCDWGRQTISQPNSGQADATVRLSHPDETNNAVLTRLDTEPASDPPTITMPAPDPSPLTISGDRLDTVTAVGFFESGASGPGPEPVVVGAADFATHTATTIRLANVPAAVTSVEGDWYVRVKIDGSWSEVYDSRDILQALRLLIGAPTLTCDQGTSDGNFGTLRLSNSEGGGTSDQIARNIANDLEHTLAVHPDLTLDGICQSGDPDNVFWTNDGTNCVGTDPGMAADAALAGFITGVGSDEGRLAHVEAGTGCAESGYPETTMVTVRKATYTINNDTLSCFLTNDTTNIGTISSSSYAGDPVLSAAIYDSPRFMFVPVLKAQPTSGSSNFYQVVGFRAAFLTDQANSATRTTSANLGNGLTLDKHGEIESVQVIFINSNALPPLDTVYTTKYAGTGPRVIRLVD